MYRHSVAAGGSGVGTSTASRDSSRSDSSYSANISFGAPPKRGGIQLNPYKLRCEKESLNPRLGPPDFYPPAPDCAEDSLTHETCAAGYKESIPGIEEQREIAYSLAANNALWAKENINRYKESLRKRLRAVTSALVRKRKAGQVYDVPLVGALLSKPGYFPERHTYGEDFRKKWLEDLSQRKRLSSLSDHVPHGFHRRTLFEALVRQNVPFLRATWFIKVLYLNQVRPGNAAGGADKSQAKRLEQWTRDFLDYSQSLLDELCATASRSSQPQEGFQNVEPDLDGVSKWHYVVRLLQWQYGEGLLQQSHVADWAIKQIQEKESLDALELLLPVVLEFMDSLSLSQVHVRTLVEICLSRLRQLGVSDALPDPDEQPQQHHVAVTLVELLRYLLVAVPDTFVAFDCFPLLPCVSVLEGVEPAKEIDNKNPGVDTLKSSSRSVTGSPYREVFIMEAVDTIQKRASSLSKAVNPGILRNNDGKVIQGLDKWLVAGDVVNAYQTLFDNDFSGYDQLPVEWKNSSSNAPFLSGMMSNVSLSDLFAVRFLCEWAICDFRDTRSSSSGAVKAPAGVRDMARIYLTSSVLSLKKSELDAATGHHMKKMRSDGLSESRLREKRSPIHQIIVAWIDQHELRKGESLEKIQLLLCELVRKGIFHPDVYVRQLIVEGLLEKRETPSDVTRAARHKRILRCLPSLSVDDVRSSDEIPENERLYRNERRLALQSFAPEEKLPSGNKIKLLGKPATAPGKKNEMLKTMKLAELKQAVCGYLQMSDSGKGFAGPAGVLKRGASALGDGHSCEECSRAKRHKSNEVKAWSSSGVLTASEPEETWWIKKVPKVSDPVKLEAASVKPKQNVRGRPKTVRKTQSLAQLHSARVDGSLGASSSHTSESKAQCPYHRPASGNKAPGSKADLRAIGSTLKQLTISEKYQFSSWLQELLRKTLTETPQSQKPGIMAATRWQLNDDMLAAVVYMLDLALDYNALVKLLLWLLPMSGASSPAPPLGVSVRAPGYGKLSCGAGEAAIVSCLRRYDVVITSLNLLPEVLNTGMQCASTIGFSSRSPMLVYFSEVYHKHKVLKTVQSWRVTCDPKLLVELEALKGGDGESGMGFIGLTSSASEERDEPPPQRLNSRLARVGVSMKDTVQKGLGEATTIILNRERDSHPVGLSASGKLDECLHRVVSALLDAIKQNGTVQNDAGLINTAVLAVVSNASSAAANAYEALNAASSGPGVSPSSSESISVRCARRILQLHVRCLCSLKEGMDDRQSRVFDVSLASEASTVVSAHLTHTHSTGKAARSQFHLSPETPEPGVLTNDFSSTQNLTISGRAAAASALLVMAVLQGALSLERLVSVLKLKDGLEALHLPKLLSGTSNGLSRAAALGGSLKADNLVEGSIHWFRTLLGDCRAIAGGLVAEFLGDANLLALARTQRLLSLNTVFPSGYAMFCGLLRRQVLSRMNIATRDDSILPSLSAAVAEIVKHEPFREVCLQDTKVLYVLLSSDPGTSDYAALLDEQAMVVRSKKEAILPFSARLFLYALLDSATPSSMQWHDEEAWMVEGQAYDPKRQVEQMVHILDELQPATFHWQWLELRLLLNEQVFVERIEAQSTAVAAVQASVGASDQLSECEKVFTESVLTGLLHRPDAGALYSEVLNALGKPLEEYVIKLVKWTLQGSDVLFGRKSLRQRWEQNKGSFKGTSGLKSWGWQPPGSSPEVASPEEGEVSQEINNNNNNARVSSSSSENLGLSQYFATEKALADLVLPCLARSQNETCSNFAMELVAQMTELEQQVTLLTRSSGRLPAPSATVDVPGSKSQSSRRGARSGLEGGSPGVRRRSGADSAPVSAAALQSSMWLRLQFLLPLLRIIYCDREQPSKNMRLTLAQALLRLLGSRIVQESAESFGIPHIHLQQAQGREGQWNSELASMAAAAGAGEELFDRLLSVLHALLSDTWAVWLKPRGRAAKQPREVPIFDREVALRMQNELDHMQLPRSLRMRLQAAMPIFPPGPTFTISAAPPQVPSSSLASLQANLSAFPQKSQAKPAPSSGDGEAWMDPWLLLEDGTGIPGGSSSAAGGDGGSLKACPWLKGAVRVRRTDLTYAGSVDSDT